MRSGSHGVVSNQNQNTLIDFNSYTVGTFKTNRVFKPLLFRLVGRLENHRPPKILCENPADFPLRYTGARENPHNPLSRTTSTLTGRTHQGKILTCLYPDHLRVRFIRHASSPNASAIGARAIRVYFGRYF